MIGKLETLPQDYSHINNVANLSKPLESGRHYHTSSGSNDRARKLFGTLRKSTIRQLYGKYRLDFEAFGYQHEDYVGYGTG